MMLKAYSAPTAYEGCAGLLCALKKGMRSARTASRSQLLAHR